MGLAFQGDIMATASICDVDINASVCKIFHRRRRVGIHAHTLGGQVMLYFYFILFPSLCLIRVPLLLGFV